MSTNEAINEPQKLPENWGPIFGLAGVQDRIGNLSWLGEDFTDMGWVVVGEAPAEPSEAPESLVAWNLAKKLLADSDWSMLSDVPLTSGDKALWIEYRRALREIRLQAGFPATINWPSRPS